MMAQQKNQAASLPFHAKNSIVLVVRRRGYVHIKYNESFERGLRVGEDWMVET